MLRKDKIEQASREKFDVAIIGGGITGAGIFLRCCQNGLKTILLDQSDFASGTSSRSAKMIHGGLRYLEHLQIKLIREALLEREHLLNLYPHLVKPLSYLMPIYGSALTKVKMKVALTGYDALAGSSSLPKYQSLSKKEVNQKYPMLRSRNLKGGVYYYDAITNDARLTNEVIMQASDMGGVAINYMDVKNIHVSEDTVESLQCRDGLDGTKIQVIANHVISAAGIWTDEVVSKAGAEKRPIMKPSKGIHLVVDKKKFPVEDTLVMTCNDGRYVWIFPWLEDLAIIGTTDTPYEGELREPGSTDEDINYLLSNLNNFLEGVQITKRDILSVYSGLRPLLNEEGMDPDKMSRDYRIWWKNNNLLVIAGGKLTSFLSMADKVLEKLVERTGNTLLEKNGEVDDPVTKDPLKSFMDKVGNQDFDTKLRFFVQNQNAEKIEDVLTRRMVNSYAMQKYDESLVNEVADVMGVELNWSEEVKQKRKIDYQEHWKTMHPW